MRRTSASSPGVSDAQLRRRSKALLHLTLQRGLLGGEAALRLLQRRFGLGEGALHVSTLGGQRRQLPPVLVELGPPLPPLSLAFLPKVRKPVRAEGRAAQGAVGLPLSQHPVAASQLHKLGIQPLVIGLQPLDGPHRRVELRPLRQHSLALPDNHSLGLYRVPESCLRRLPALHPWAQFALHAVPQPVRLRGQPVRLLCNGILQVQARRSKDASCC